jgi:hypothetical protein
MSEHGVVFGEAPPEKKGSVWVARLDLARNRKGEWAKVTCTSPGAAGGMRRHLRKSNRIKESEAWELTARGRDLYFRYLGEKDDA